ncbi:MAG: exodeoxyribonuclease VII large subunit [Treponema sp.]|jgi:exodeoxyribonuclease VII large subunit|nr:exodeoxyribonuclease VII large subunit [Treponema sp.]
MGAYSVTEITDLIKGSLEGSFSAISVEGELSNCRPSSTGHLYFTLKDAVSCISAVMFKNRFRSLSFEPKDGMLLRVHGSISVYNQRGTYQIVCDEMERTGEGEMLALLEKRKRAFAMEGLFDEGKKTPIPRFPQTVGVVSSPTGAAVRDILNILRRRAVGVNVVVLPCPVQGNDAAPIIARRIEQANLWKLADVLIVGRGGGSLEDMLPFSEEVVVRAVAASAIPVVSAVGHEIDWALSDFAADLRAPTPSAAAELVSANREETLIAIQNIAKFLFGTIKTRLERARFLAKPFTPAEMEYRFRAILQPYLVHFDDAKEELLISFGNRLADVRKRLALAKRTLETANPELVLEKGYSIVTNMETGCVVRAAADVKTGDALVIRPLRGEIRAVVGNKADQKV